MDLLIFVQKFFILLLPGVLGLLLYNALSIHKEQHYSFEFLKLLCFSFIAYLLTDVLFGVIKWAFPCFRFDAIDIIQQISSEEAALPSANVIMSIIWAIIVACILTKASYENWLFKMANKLKLTCRVDDRTVWEHIFDMGETIVLRDQVTGNIYYGTVDTFSDNSDNREICFGKVYVFDKFGKPLYDAESLYLSRAHNEFTIEIPDDKDGVELKEETT